MPNRTVSPAQRKHGEKGHAVIEVALLAPWIFLLFAAVFDFGFYMYAAISVQNAARVAALRISDNYTAASDPNASAVARVYVCAELRSLPNIGTSCPTSVLTVTVPAQPFAVPAGDTAPGATATQVSVTYTTVSLIPLPFLTGQWTFTRVVEAKVS